MYAVFILRIAGPLRSP